MKQASGVSTNQSIVGAEKGYGHEYRVTISGSTDMLMEQLIPYPVRDTFLFFLTAIRSV